MKISIVAAIGLNGELGKENKLLWHLPADLKFFKELTIGKPVIMGRKTFESIGKALPGRKNIVISRKDTHTDLCVSYLKSLKDAFDFLNQEDEIYIIGGAEIYAQSIDHCTDIYLTRVQQRFEADTFFPVFPKPNWKIKNSTFREKDEKNPYNMVFEHWIR